MLDIIRSNAQSWGVKIIFALIIVVFVFWGVGSFRATDPMLLVKVNGTPITAQDFITRLRPQLDALRTRYPNLSQDDMQNILPALREQVLQSMVVDTLLAQQSERTGIVVTPQELRREIERIPIFHNAQGAFDAETYARALKAQNIMPGTFESQVRRDMLIRKFQGMTSAAAFVTPDQAKALFMFQAEQRVLEAIVFNTESYMDKATPEADAVTKYYEAHQAEFQIPAQADVQYVSVTPETLAAAEKVSDADAQAYYQNNQDRYRRPERVRARHILVLADRGTDKATDDAARAKIDDAAQQIKSGKPFADVARAVSQDGSAQDGGELGWFGKGQMVPEFEAAAFNLAPGALSEPVRTQFGWHLVQVDERQPEEVMPFADVAEDIVYTIAIDRVRPKVQELLDNLLIAVINGQSLQEAAAKYNLAVEQTGMQDADSLAQTIGLKPADVQTLMSAPANKTLDTAFSTGEGYVIANPLTSEPAKTQPFDDVRADIEAQLRLEKARQLAQDAAVAARATITAPDVPAALKGQVVDTPPMSRDGLAPGFSEANPLLAEAVFADTSSNWLPTPYAVDAGAALIRVKAIIPPTDETWNMVQTQLIRALTNAKQEKQYLSFLSEVYRTATIEPVNMQLLNDIR